MSDTQKQAFAQAIASVSLETNALTDDVIQLLEQAIIEKKTVGELLDTLESAS